MFLEFLDDLVDDFQLLLGGHLGQHQQRVLQGDVLGIDSQFVEHIAALLEQFVVGIVLVDQRNGFGIAGLCVIILAPCKVDATQGQLADGLVHTVAGTLFGSEPVVLDGVERVAMGEVEVTDSVIDLIQVFLVAVIAGHTLQGFHLAGNVGTLIDGALLDAGVEFRAIGRTAATTGLLVGKICVVLVAHLFVKLSEQEIHPHLFIALEAFNGFGKIRDGQFWLLSLDVIIGKGGVGQCADAFIGDFIQMDVGEHVIGFGWPPHSAIAQGLTNLAFLY